MTEEKKLTPEQLTEALTIAAAELCWLGAPEDDPHLHSIEAALPILTHAWGLPESHLQERITFLRREQAAIKRFVQGGEAASAVPQELFRMGMGAKEMRPVVAAINETSNRVERDADKSTLRGLARFLARTWISGEMEPREFEQFMMSW